MKYREIMSQFSTALGKLDMTYALVAHEYNLTFNGLMTLYIIDESDTVTQKEISEILFLPKSTVHSLLLKLQKQDILQLTKGKNEKEKFIRLEEHTSIFGANENFYRKLARKSTESYGG